MQRKCLFLLWFAFNGCVSAAAQPNDVLQNKDVTPDALINALQPKPGVAAGGSGVGLQADTGSIDEGSPIEGRTRQFKMVRDRPSAGSGAAPKPAPAALRPSASLMITFESASSRLTQISRRILDAVAQALNSEKLVKYSFNIEGYADPTGIADLNVKLSEERAVAVRKYLVTTHSVDAARLIAVGKGSSELLNTSNPTAPENRRVRIVNISQ